MMPVRARRFAAAILFCFACAPAAWSQGVIIPTDSRQADFIKAYRCALNQANVDYRFTNASLDTALFPRWGEFSVYWTASGPENGSFVHPDVLPSAYTGASTVPYTAYDWRSEDHYAISFKGYAKTIGIFKSAIRQNNSSVSWEAVYFKNLIESFLMGGVAYYLPEKEIDSSGIIWTTQLLVIPAFASQGTDWRHYMDSLFVASPRLKNNLLAYLARGGTIYTEGNAVYMIEKLGLLPVGSVDYAQSFTPDPASGTIEIDVVDPGHPVARSAAAAGYTIYAGDIPTVTAPAARVLATVKGSSVPVVFSLAGSAAGNGRIICNTALPAVGASNALQAGTNSAGARQFQWVLNAVLYAFSTSVDVTRSIWNDIPDSLSCGRNAASFDRRDTLEVRVKLRNLSSAAVTGISVRETVRDFFQFVDVRTAGVTSSYTKPYLTLSDISLQPHSEMVIVYRIATPDPADAIHEKVDSYISWASYIYASLALVTYADAEGAVSYQKYRNYVDMLFSARVVADADCNWKNFLGLYYQPFKVFMIMENKERTAATGARYVQYVPKDVPFYWTDNTLDIPILKTPGGKFVDVLRGSSSESAPEYDMDNDGHPDAWLDTASIFPKNYTIEETSVYWLNPWEHLRSGNTALYEDIDHDGIRAQDTDGDGVVDVEEPGDKIRVWKLTWPVGKISGYQFHDPYCSYELWVDPPDLVPMSAGVAHARGTLDQAVPGMFYPYSKSVDAPDLADTSWTHWMERDASGFVDWKQLVYQSIHNYEGFTFIDTLSSRYRLAPTDRCAGTVPQPHREFIAVLSLGGEEIDMNNYTPKQSQYSNLEYTTIFGEKRNTPIRTTYTYYAPLPNPLQFEYITNNFTITDPASSRVLPALPAYGKANLTFDIDASTEYTYYWIRNAGHDVDFNDPSLANEGNEKLGDGVFGYMLYDIPKGMGGYKITLPKTTDGRYDIDRIVQVDGKPYHPWLKNPNTKDSVQILEDQFAFHVFIPQVLIPPALDDDNFDGIDDWIDDRGDRFQSRSGFLHDAFMTGNGESYPDEPKTPFKDDIYGMVTSGWSCGADNTYGDDFFENLGKTHFTITAQYEGNGREGSVDISKGGWLVVEEIFGGSPWVLFSHALSAYAEGVKYSLTSSVAPTVARYGIDTVYVKHVIDDKGEPHAFDVNFDPFQVSRGYGQSSVTTYAGGKDPCGLIDPSATLSTIIDPARNTQQLTLIPNANPANPDLAGYPKTVNGAFIEARIEVSNGTDFNWINTSVTPVIPKELGSTSLVMSYVSYPRPLVPAQADPVTGKVTHAGDDPTTFTTGWRFNQPEGEVLVKMGNTLNLIQPSRRAYFVFLFQVDETLPKGVYNIPFTMNGAMRKYDGTYIRNADFAVAPCMFSISTRDARGSVAEYQKIVIGQGTLGELRSAMLTPFFRGLENARYSARDVTYTDFDTLRALPAVYDAKSGVETIDLAGLGLFPTKDLTRLTILEQGEVTSHNSTEQLAVTSAEALGYNSDYTGPSTLTYRGLALSTVGPKVILYKTVSDVHGRRIKDGTVPQFLEDEEREVQALFEITNQGASIAENVRVTAECGSWYRPLEESLPPGCAVNDGVLTAAIASLLPGETKQFRITYRVREAACASVYDSTAVVRSMAAVYNGAYAVSGKLRKDVFSVPDPTALPFEAYDVQVMEIETTPPQACQGRLMRVDARIANGVVPISDADIAIRAVVNGTDTVRLGVQTITRLESNARGIVSMLYVVPDTARSVEFLAFADPARVYGEMCEQNNVASLRVPLRGPDWMIDVTQYPNPARGDLLFAYTLPGNVERLALTLYSLDSREVLRLSDLPVSLGRHSFAIPDADLPAGTYMFRFDGADELGGGLVHSGSFVKMK